VIGINDSRNFRLPAPQKNSTIVRYGTSYVISLSLSLYTYIYIYVYLFTRVIWRASARLGSQSQRSIMEIAKSTRLSTIYICVRVGGYFNHVSSMFLTVLYPFGLLIREHSAGTRPGKNSLQLILFFRNTKHIFARY